MKKARHQRLFALFIDIILYYIHIEERTEKENKISIPGKLTHEITFLLGFIPYDIPWAIQINHGHNSVGSKNPWKWRERGGWSGQADGVTVALSQLPRVQAIPMNVPSTHAILWGHYLLAHDVIQNMAVEQF